jgi:tRNA pseudouridine65 synthase
LHFLVDDLSSRADNRCDPRHNGGVRLVHVDEWLVVVDKPSGLVVHRGQGVPVSAALLQKVRDAVGAHVNPVHRLDRGASGIVLFARTAEATAALQAQLESGSADKRYLALVRGRPPGAGQIDSALPRREGGPEVPAQSSYLLLESVDKGVDERGRPRRYSLVEVCPKTGRLHQVRRHMKHISHPIIGDANYGRGEHNRYCKEQYGLGRLALHACTIEIEHPATHQRMHFAAPVPDDLAVPLVKMGFPPALLGRTVSPR